MSHAPSSHFEHARWQWWVIFAATVIGLVFGTSGFHQYEHAEHTAQITKTAPNEFVEWLTSLYYAGQMFILHTPHLDKPTNLHLEIGRWAAAVAFGFTALLTLYHVFAAESRLIRLAFMQGHVVICGLGKVGLPLALELRKRGVEVVVIESRGQVERALSAAAAGAAVVVGDASSQETLVRAGVVRAKEVIAVCDDEQTNVGVATAVGHILAKSRSKPRSPLECWIFIADTRLRRNFQQPGLFPRTNKNYIVNVRGLDFFELAARQALEKAPLDFESIRETDSTVAHLVVVGFGPMGQHMALQAAKICHFANFKRLRLTVVEGRHGSHRDEFLGRYPRFAETCDVQWVKLGADLTSAAKELAALGASPAGQTELTSYAFCWDGSSESSTSESEMFQRLERNDPVNLMLALDVAAEVTSQRSQFLIFQTRRHGFGALFPTEGRGAVIGIRMHAFGMLEETCSLATLLQEQQDQLAKALHEDYYSNQLKNPDNKPGSKPALYPWDQLAEHFKNSNRQAADHIPVKLRAIGLRMDALGIDKVRTESLEGPQLELLSRMEHERWCTDLRLQGYAYGEGKRDEIKKTHPCLVSWEKLDKGTQEWDRDQVKMIPEALKLAKKGIYSQSQ